ncbi:uncharacterized protein LOC113234910 [Hyposmocoma kahamanoa]|uniref:uncharacterized protein LOC113234910 n=1 Tax=Hyposmocoma kahamanoa TaxID=1477025 RepID=UPI000E6D6DA6|nr:uncharacterized protein LOC113234910 [Hyposmocoma kahamanoa]
MPRIYKRKLGSREYRNYTEARLEEALTQIVDGKLTIRGASQLYNISYGTLYNKYKGTHVKKPGAQPVFSESEEEALLKSAAKCADWGYPLTILDLRFLAKAFLDRQGRVVSKFTNNLPGVEWVYSLLRRHKGEYSQRVSSNIKKARANVSHESIHAYFNNLTTVVKDLPASNIFNYDETNMSDDPGKKQGIYRRGVKYPEKIINFSKSATTVMVCGSADGVILPPYVIYKSAHLYDTWKEEGPRGAPCCGKTCCSQGSRFNRTSSGWIDSITFRDWFRTSFLPHAKALPGRKVLIGDNLSSHMDDDVLNECEKNNIDFVCLVPYSTHLCQPLDVAFFRPMKSAWRNVLTNWKMQNPRLSTVPKDTFPRLLQKALKKIDSVQAKPNSPFANVTEGVKRNLMSAFKATGIFPLSREQVLKRLPIVENSDPTNEVESCLTDYLREQRYGGQLVGSRRRTRLNVEPGASVSTANAVDTQAPERDAHDLNASNMDQGNLPSNNVEEVPRDLVPIDEATESENPVSETQEDLEVGRFVLVKFYSRRGKKTYKYVCRITCMDPLLVEGFKSMGNKKDFRLVRDDISEIEETDILSYLSRPRTFASKDNVECVQFNFDVNILELP